jgi:hypothetical protein
MPAVNIEDVAPAYQIGTIKSSADFGKAPPSSISGQPEPTVQRPRAVGVDCPEVTQLLPRDDAHLHPFDKAASPTAGSNSHLRHLRLINWTALHLDTIYKQMLQIRVPFELPAQLSAIPTLMSTGAIGQDSPVAL